MGNIGLAEIFVVMVLALLVFGPNRLPEIMRNVGKAVRTFQEESRRAASVLREGLEERPAAGVIDTPDAPRAPASVEAAPPPRSGPPPEVKRDIVPAREFEDT